MSAILIDTNVLVYSVDRGEFEKQARAIDLLNRLQPTGAGCIPVQCLSEFFVVSTRSIRGRPALLTPPRLPARQRNWVVLSARSS